jgi:hypothetical protein
MKIGLLACGFDCEENIDKVLKPWVNLKSKYDITISFVNCQFSEYSKFYGEEEVKDPNWLERHKNSIDYFFSILPASEAEARNCALAPLIENNVDFIWLLDCDEFYTEEMIESIIKFISYDKFIAWYKLSFKNKVFTANQYLQEPFTPPRIFRTSVGKFKLDKLSWDNDFTYKAGDKEVSHLTLGHQTVPAKVAWIPHESWLNTLKNKKKIEYHHAHFGQGNCSYAWCEENGLIFNESYYNRYGLPFPVVLTENSQ